MLSRNRIGTDTLTQKRLEGKNAVITGGAGGIAVATAISFAGEGANVVVVDIDQAGVEKTAEKAAVKGVKAKAAVSILTQYIAKDVGPYGITANTIAPGTTLTDRVDKLLTPEKREIFSKACPLGHLAEPDEIAGVIVFLASDESRYITGATIDVNGGRLMLV